MNASLWIAHPLLAWAVLLPAPAGALWMALGPQVPALRERRALLAWLTWLATRPGFVLFLRLLQLPNGRPAWAEVMPHGAPPAFGGPWLLRLLAHAHLDAGGPGTALLALAADFVAWRALAAETGDASEAAWNWVAAPLVWYLAALSGGAEMLGAACLACAWLLSRRSRALEAGLALAGAVALAGPVALLPALAIVLGAQSRVRSGAAALVALASLAFALGAVGASPLALVRPEPVAFGTGPTLWRVPALLANLAPGPWGALPLGLLLALGAVLLSLRRADMADHAAWGAGAFAACAPALGAAAPILWAPLLAAWAGPDPDRRGWWLLWASLLPLAAWLDAGPLLGALGPTWRLLAALGVTGTALLALWPLRTLAFPPRALPVRRRAR